MERTAPDPAPTARPVGNLYFGQWTGQFPIPSMIVAEDGRLLWTNPAADAVLATAREFQAVNGVLVCVDKSQAAELRAFLTGLGDEADAWVYRREDTAHHLLRAEKVRPDGLPPATALMIYPIDAEDRYIWSDFHKVFGLTRAETVVVKRIIGGEAADAIAEEMSIALDTVRTHVRRIYTKLGVKNREQLFSKISPFRIR
jgi:DNA-binding CsgD family transcriptional regulator